MIQPNKKKRKIRKEKKSSSCCLFLFSIVEGSTVSAHSDRHGGATIAGVIREGSLFILGRKITASNVVDVGNTEEKKNNNNNKGKGKKKQSRRGQERERNEFEDREHWRSTEYDL